MVKRSNSMGKIYRKMYVCGKKNFLEIFNVALIIYFLLSLWLVISKYQFVGTDMLLLPLYFHLWIFGDTLGFSALTVIVMMWLGLRKRHSIGYFILRSVLLAQVVSSVWMIACGGKIIFFVEGTSAGLLFYFMESNRIKAKFKVEKMNRKKLYGYMLIVLTVVNYFQLCFQEVANSWSVTVKAKVFHQGRSDELAISPDGKVLIFLDYQDRESIYLYKTGMKLDDKALIKKIKKHEKVLKVSMTEMALNDNHQLLAVAYRAKDKVDSGFIIYDMDKAEWIEGFWLPNEETRKNLKLSGEYTKDSEYNYIGNIYKLQFNDTGEYLAVMRTFGVEFWDIKDKRLLKQMNETSRDKIYWLEGTKYLRITDRKIYFGDLFEGEEEQAAIEAVSFIEVRVSPDKKCIAVISNHEEIPSFYIWDIERREKIWEKSFYDIKRKEISILPIKEIQKKLLAEKYATTRRIQDVGFSPDNKMLVVLRKEEEEDLLSVMDIASGKVYKETIKARGGAVRDTKFIENNKIITIGRDWRECSLAGAAIIYMLDEPW